MLLVRKTTVKSKDTAELRYQGVEYSSVVEHSTSMHNAQVQFPVMEKKKKEKEKQIEPSLIHFQPLARDSTTGTYLNSPGPRCHLQEQLGQMRYKVFPSIIFYAMMSA